MGMDDFESDPLWELLGRARRPEAPPWLATRILAIARHEASAVRHRRFGGLWRWLAVPAGAAALWLAILTINRPTHDNIPSDAPQLFAAFEAFADNAFEADYLWSNNSY